MNKKSFLAVVSGLVLAMTTYNALAFTCTTTITGQTINGGVEVPDNAECTLRDVRVNGGVTVGANASLLVCDSRINGGVQAEGSNDIHLGEVDTDGPCPGNDINGGVTIQGALGAELDSNHINGTVKLQNNGTVEVENNSINGSLQCSGNTTIITEGFPNTVTGQETGKCVGF